MADETLLMVARGSVQDGLGHIMRTRAVADELCRMGVRLKLLILGDESCISLLQHTTLPYEFCESDEQVVSQVLQSEVGCVVFDMLRFDQAGFLRIKACCRTLSLSPVFSCLPHTDDLFHRTVYEDPEWSVQKPFPRIHSGLKYTIVSERCHRIPSQIYRSHLKKSPLSIGISMGGADAANRTLAILNALKNIQSSLLIWVALGEAYTHSYEALVAAVRGTRHEVILIKSNESMWRVLQNACVLICSGGLTTYEAAFAGLPSINIPAHPTRNFLIRELEEKGACIILDSDAAGLASLVTHIESWEANRAPLMQLHLTSKRLLSPHGTRRVAQAIRKIAVSRRI
jgi:spore coat polysaccharide biosynthesis predicted glycosyltransferase SpsG